MRADMHKVIVERPRSGSRLKNKKTALRLTDARVAEAAGHAEDFDGGPLRASSGRRDKHLNENLAPLRRYLERQVGRPWDKVWGEILQGVDTRSAVGLHVLQHVPGFVHADTFIEDRVVYCRWYGHVQPVYGLYVHPKSGLLRSAVRKRPSWSDPRKEEQPADMVPIRAPLEFDNVRRMWRRVGPMSWYQKIDGLWYVMDVQYNNPCDWVRRSDGVWRQAASLPGFEPFIVVSKKQCDRKTVRKIEAGEFGETVNCAHFLRTQSILSRKRARRPGT